MIFASRLPVEQRECRYNLYKESEASEPRMSEAAWSIMPCGCLERALLSFTFVSKFIRRCLSICSWKNGRIGSKLRHFCRTVCTTPTPAAIVGVVHDVNVNCISAFLSPSWLTTFAPLHTNGHRFLPADQSVSATWFMLIEDLFTFSPGTDPQPPAGWSHGGRMPAQSMMTFRAPGRRTAAVSTCVFHKILSLSIELYHRGKPYLCIFWTFMRAFRIAK